MTFKEFYISQTGLPEEAVLPYPVIAARSKKASITAYGDVRNAVYFLNPGAVEMTIKSYD